MVLCKYLLDRNVIVIITSFRDGESTAEDYGLNPFHDENYSDPDVKKSDCEAFNECRVVHKDFVKSAETRLKSLEQQLETEKKLSIKRKQNFEVTKKLKEIHKTESKSLERRLGLGVESRRDGAEKEEHAYKQMQKLTGTPSKRSYSPSGVEGTPSKRSKVNVSPAHGDQITSHVEGLKKKIRQLQALLVAHDIPIPEHLIG